MKNLSDRLEIRLPSSTMQRLRQEAQRRDLSIGALVREAIDRMLEGDRAARLKAAEELFRVDAPVSDWPTMKQEIVDAHRTALP